MVVEMVVDERAARRAARAAVIERATAIWPRIDRRVLASWNGDPRRLAHYLARRTVLPEERILEMLEPPMRDEATTWFG